MATSDVEICNSALQKLGAETITTLADNSRRASLCNRQYDKIRKKLLRAHPWNFAIKRAALVEITEAVTSVNLTTDVFTAGTLSLVTGDRVRFELLTGTLPEPVQENIDYYAIKTSSTEFKIATTAANANAGTQIDIIDAPSFTATVKVRPPFEWDSQFSLPSDYIRGIREEYKTTDWKIERGRLLANDGSFNLLYISDVTDTTLFDSHFDELFALSLAYEISYSMVQSLQLRQDLKQELNELLRDTRSFDAQEGTPEDFEVSDWLTSRQ